MVQGIGFGRARIELCNAAGTDRPPRATHAPIPWYIINRLTTDRGDGKHLEKHPSDYRLTHETSRSFLKITYSREASSWCWFRAIRRRGGGSDGRLKYHNPAHSGDISVGEHNLQLQNHDFVRCGRCFLPQTAVGFTPTAHFGVISRSFDPCAKSHHDRLAW